jgi:glycosyltransferase involved in cell wall biosynthesis
LHATPHLNVIVPCYNPPEGWESALASRFKAFREAASDLAGEIGLVVVNDGSARQAGEANFRRLQELVPGARVVSYAENRGKGYALRQGVAASQADWHLVTDTDFPYTLDSMRRVVQSLQTRPGIAAGNRNSVYYDSVPLFRRLLSKSLRWMLRNVLRQPITDSQCGLKAFDNAGREVFLETTIDRFLFDLEFLMLANGRVGVTPVPVELRDGVVFSQVGWKILATEGGNFMRLLLQQRRPRVPKTEPS